jgi:GNAT superfamily N-acetyltransferase
VPNFVVKKASFEQTSAVMSVLPELMSSEILPPNFIVAHPHDDPSRILGAAAFVPKIHNTEKPGFICHCRVLPAFRKQGIGSAFIQHLAKQVASWDVDYLHTASTYDDGSSEAEFLKRLGFDVSSSMHHFMSHAAGILPMFNLLHRQVKALYGRDRIPKGFAIKSFSDIQPDAVANLYCRQFGGSMTHARNQIKLALKDPNGEKLSLSLSDGNQLAGFLVASHDKTSLEIKYWVTDPTFGPGWSAALLLDGCLSRANDLGLTQGRYSCNDKTRATLNIARKTGAQLEFLRRSYVLDISSL